MCESLMELIHAFLRVRNEMEAEIRTLWSTKIVWINWILEFVIGVVVTWICIYVFMLFLDFLFAVSSRRIVV